MKKKLVSLLLALCLIISALPAAALAAEPELAEPVVQAKVRSGEIRELTASEERPTLNATYYDNLEDAAAYVRQYMIKRMDTISVSIVMDVNGLTEDVLVEWGNRILEQAFAYNFDAKGGDYLMLNTPYIEFEYDGFVDEENRAFLDYTYYYTYLTTAEQEEEVDQEVDRIMSELDIDSLETYGRAKAIYDYVCANVNYEGIVTEDTLIVKLTAYSALLDGTATDYGIAAALYRLANEASVTCRVFFGLVDGQERFWNSINIDGWDYYADAALDSGTTEHKYFLKGTKSMSNYVADESFAPSGGVYEYGYAVQEHDFGPDFGHQYEKEELVQEATCTQDGIYRRICGCGYVDEQITPATGHVCAEGTVTKEPTCTETGVLSCVCDTCGEEYTEELEMVAHSYESAVTKEPTCTELGEKTFTCTSCGGKYTEDIALVDHIFENDECTICGDGAVYRISGASRYATAYAAADVLKETLDVDSFNTIIVASGDSFADALTGSYLAAVREAPILLHNDKVLEDNVAYITENLAEGGRVCILGGTSSVSQALDDALKAEGIDVQRFAGSDRYETNLAILEAAGVADEEILVCTADNFADSLSASAAGLPILLVNNKTGQLTDGQKEFLDALEGNAITIIGGVNSVSEAMEETLGAYGTVKRVSGASREETSVKFAEKYFEAPEYALLAYSWNFPDGLCGGPLAYAMGAPLLLTSAGNEESAAAYVAEAEIIKGYVLGGTATVKDASVRIIFAMNDNTQILTK